MIPIKIYVFMAKESKFSHEKFWYQNKESKMAPIIAYLYIN